MDDMLETMYDAPGIGLAAIQIGVAKRIIVIDVGRPVDEAGEDIAEPTKEQILAARTPMYFVNPEITWASDEMVECQEGCLSVPDLDEDVERPARVKVKFLDYHGKPQEIDCEGLLAVCIQHEMDHLEGILFIDHLSSLKRNMMLKKLASPDAVSSAKPPNSPADQGRASRFPRNSQFAVPVLEALICCRPRHCLRLRNPQDPRAAATSCRTRPCTWRPHAATASKSAHRSR
jgi:peptide deformylase